VLHLQVAGDVRPLADGLATVLAEPLADPFAREWIGVPTDGMQRWLKLHLAHRLGTSGAGHGDGVVANLDVRYPGTLRQVVLAAARQDPDTGGNRVDPGAADPWRPEHLVWAVLELLRTDPDPARFGPLATLPDGATWFGRALRVAQLFDHYAVRRPDLLLDWAGDRAVDAVGAPLGDADRWQFALWRAARDRLGVPSPPELVAGVLPGVRAGTADLALPPRLAVFGLTTLPYGAPFLDLLDAVATHRDVHVFLLDPSAPASARVRAAVLDDEHSPVPRRADDRTDAVVAHPLLRSWGRPYRERTVLLARAEDHGVAPATRIGTDADAADAAGPTGTPATLLARLQQDLRADRAPDATFTPPPGDRSLQVHSCHGPTRQVEVLRDTLLHLLADDPTLREDDIVVCCPDLETYAPLVEAGFGPSALRGGGAPVSAADAPPRLAYSVADRSLREAYPTLVALDALLGLAAGRATATAVLEFLALAPVRLRFGLDDEALATIGAWTAETNVRWGFDGAHRARWGLPAGFTLNSWRAALDRLLLGVAVSDDDLALTVGDIAPLGVEGNDIETVGRLAEVVALLADTAADFATPRTAVEWSEALRAVADRAFAAPRGEAWQRDRLHRIVDALATDSVVAGHPVEVPLDLADVRRFLADRLDGVPTRADWFRGGVTVTSLTPMRGLPFRVVAILGFDDVARGAAPDGDDLGARHPRVGDRDPRTETRQALLDAVLAAGDHLVITRTGHDVRTNRTQPYGVALAELRDVVVATIAPAPTGGPDGEDDADPDAARWARVETLHPHQAFDEVNLTNGALGVDGPFTFDPQARAGAEARRDRATEPDPFLAEPLAPVGDAPGTATPTIDPAALHHFFREPVGAFLRGRLGLHLPRDDAALDDDFVLSLHSLAEWKVGDRVVGSRMGGVDRDIWVLHERALGTLPPGAYGDAALARFSEASDNLIAAVAATGLDPGRTRDVAIDLVLADGTRIVGTVTVCDGTGDPGPLRVTYSKVKPRQELEAWLDLMLLVAQDPTTPWRSIAVRRADRSKSVTADVCELRPATTSDPRAAALDALGTVAAVYHVGMCEPIPLFPVASKGIYLGAPGEGDWSNFGGFGDGTLDTTVIAFGECSLQEILALPVAEHDPGDPEAGGSRAEWYANRVWGTIEATCTGLDTDTDNDDTRDTGDTGDGGDT
jgi:exodeoxyribonuclease V gamma subunit